MLNSLQNQHSPARSAWSVNAVVQAVFLAGIAVAITGCGASKKTTLTKEWQTEVGDKARTVAVEPQRGHLLVGQNKNTTVMDATGSVVYGQEEEESGLSGFISEAKDAATSVDAETEGPLGAEEANQLDYVVLSDPGLALAFDYTADDDIIRAIDLGSGKQRWEQADYRWSLEKYRSGGQEIAEEVAKRAGADAGQAASNLSAELTRSRFVENLVVPLPEQNGLLLKTVTRLQLVDLGTGEARWSIPDVAGSRLMDTERLPSGDLILAVGNASLMDLISGSNQVMRLDPESGEVMWKSDHDARELRDLQVKNSHLLLTSTQGEMMAYQLEDGTQTLDADPGWKLDQVSEMAVTASYRGNRYSAPLTSSPAMQDGQVYAPAVIDQQTVGDPDLGVHNHSLRSGEQAWTSEPVATMRDVRDLTVVGEQVIGRVTRGRPGALTTDSYQRVVAWNPSDGTIEWNQKMPYEAPSVHAIRRNALGQEPLPKLNLVTRGDQVYTMNDTSVVALDATSGEVAEHTSAKVSGAAAWLTEAGPNALMALREEGVAFYATSDLSRAGSPITFDNSLVTFSRKGNHLFAQTDEAIYVVNVPQQTLAGTIQASGVGGLVSGNLRRGFAPTDDGRAVFVLTEDWVVQKYRIP
jgi:outer membrane protein assembly factor BamB